MTEISGLQMTKSYHQLVGKDRTLIQNLTIETQPNVPYQNNKSTKSDHTLRSNHNLKSIDLIFRSN